MDTVVLAGALKAADDFSVWVVDQGMADFAVRIQRSLTADVITNPFLLLVLGGIGVVLGALQWVLGFVRQAGILVLAALLPLAASGSINESTKPWLNRMLPWLVTLVLYRPIAAMIYTIGFTFLGAANDVTTAMTGLMVLVLSAVAMPAMMRFFSWAGVSVGGGGGAVMAGAIGAASLVGAAGRAPANQQANYMAANGPGSGTPPPAGAVASGGPPAGPVGPGGGDGRSELPGGAGPAGGLGAGASAGGAGSSPGAAPGGGASGAGGAVGSGLAAGAVIAGAEAFHGAQRAAEGTADRMTGGEQR